MRFIQNNFMVAYLLFMSVGTGWVIDIWLDYVSNSFIALRNIKGRPEHRHSY